MTRSRPSSRSTSALVGEWTPPSRCASPSITTGAKKPGMAHDAATASATRWPPVAAPEHHPPAVGLAHRADPQRIGRPGVREQRADALRDHVGAHRALGEQRGGQRGRPGASTGAARRGASVAARSAAGARLPGRPQRRRARDRPQPAQHRLPLGRQRTVLRPGEQVRAPGSPARSEVPEIDPADVPTMIDACRGSHPARRRAPRARPRGTRRRRPHRRPAPTRHVVGTGSPDPVDLRRRCEATRIGGQTSSRAWRRPVASRYSSTRRWITWRSSPPS